MTWWKKQPPRGYRWLCWFNYHDDYKTGEPHRRFCSRCRRLA